MLTSFIDAVHEAVTATVPAGAPVSRQRLVQPDIPRPIGHFLEQTLERRIVLQITGLDDIAPEWVDHRSAEVAAGREAFARVLTENAQFPVEEWPRALRQAVERVVTHLVRPVPTFVHFLFGEDGGPVSRQDLLRRTGYFVAHAYLRTTAEALIERTGSGPIERRELSEALERVERSVTAEWSTDDWLRALGPLTDLARYAGLEGVPLPVLDAFFEAKDAPLLAARVQAYGKRQRQAALSEAAIREALADRPADAEPVRPRPSAAESRESVPLWQQFRSGAEPAAGSRVAAAPGEPLWKRFREPAAEGDATALHLLEQDVLGEDGTRQREVFVSSLFGGSEEAYARLLGRLRAATSWAAASRILGEDLFRKHKIDIYSPPAVDFTNAVEHRFRRDR